MSGRVTLDTAAKKPRCLINGTLDFNTATEVLEGVSAHIAQHAALDIDLSGVTRSNSAALALLIEWRATAKRAEHDVTFHHIPDGLRQLAGVCQVDGLI